MKAPELPPRPTPRPSVPGCVDARPEGPPAVRYRVLETLMPHTVDERIFHVGYGYVIDGVFRLVGIVPGQAFSDRGAAHDAAFLLHKASNDWPIQPVNH